MVPHCSGLALLTCFYSLTFSFSLHFPSLASSSSSGFVSSPAPSRLSTFLVRFSLHLSLRTFTPLVRFVCLLLLSISVFCKREELLVAGQEIGIPTFEASDLEQGGKSARIVNSVLALKSYSEWKQTGGNGKNFERWCPKAMDRYHSLLWQIQRQAHKWLGFFCLWISEFLKKILNYTIKSRISRLVEVDVKHREVFQKPNLRRQAGLKLVVHENDLIQVGHVSEAGWNAPCNLLLARTMTEIGELPRTKTKRLNNSLGTFPSYSLSMRSKNLCDGRPRTTSVNLSANLLLLRSSS
ncbi:hypothetical protein VNO78_00007 [Psophocarpus tetragonolobus]|uniref:Uncharacterized protein n=1 Tax=Psophocarpus tetragonolobus TaxID=3891 RepID=A0AAN9SZW1_PSOTE